MDYGAAVSQKGYDVKTCADRFLSYSSAFQTLKIYNVYSVSATLGDTITINHNLGYYAPFLIIYNGSTTRGYGNSYFFSSGGYDIIGHAMFANSLEIYTTDSGSNVGDTLKYTVYIFLDNFRTVAQNTINSDTSSGASSDDYGIRISKDGYDVKDTADVNCVFSSSFYTAIVHKKGIESAVTSISHDLGYVPNAWLFLRNLTPGSDDYISFFTTPRITPTVLNTYNSYASYYVIFKNKLN